MYFSDNWKEHPELQEKINKIESLHKLALSDTRPEISRTAVCRKSDFIKIEIPKTYNKNYFVAEEFSRSIGKHDNSNDIHTVSLHISEIDNIVFLLHCIGEKVGYGIALENLKYPEIVDFLNYNHPMYILANEITKLLIEYNRAPSVYYASPVESARKTVNNYRKEQNAKINELYTQMIADKKVAIQWKSEYKLYATVKKIYPDAIYQYRSEWLKQQSLDIFIPSISTAIEYQGKQHYEPVQFFGGEESFADSQERDKRKFEKCQKNGVKLIYWKYDTQISVKNLISAIEAE